MRDVVFTDFSMFSLGRKQGMARPTRDRFQRYSRSSAARKFWPTGFPATNPASRVGSTTSRRPRLPEPGLTCNSCCPEPISFRVSGLSATCRASYTCSPRAVSVGSPVTSRCSSTLQVLLRRPCDRLDGQAAGESIAPGYPSYECLSANSGPAVLVDIKPPNL